MILPKKLLYAMFSRKLVRRVFSQRTTTTFICVTYPTYIILTHVSSSTSSASSTLIIYIIYIMYICIYITYSHHLHYLNLNHLSSSLYSGLHTQEFIPKSHCPGVIPQQNLLRTCYSGVLAQELLVSTCSGVNTEELMLRKKKSCFSSSI